MGEQRLAEARREDGEAEHGREGQLEAGIERLSGVDCCASPVLSPAEARRHPHLLARGMFVDADSAGTDTDQLAFPLHMSEFTFGVERPAPGHGEHSREILAEIGYDQGRIEALEAKGII